MSCPLSSRFVALGVLACVTFAPAMASVPFDAHVQVLPEEVRLPRWEAALRGIQQDRVVMRTCLDDADQCTPPRLAAWRQMMLAAARAPWHEKLEAVNTFVNQVPYVRDLDRFGVVDYWAPPLQFFAGGGDCEDYAIAKYVSLRKLGLPAERLRIVVLEDVARGLAHAILAVRLDGEVWVLDNYYDAIARFSELTHYAPYYAVNEDQRWLHRLPGEPVPAGRTH